MTRERTTAKDSASPTAAQLSQIEALCDRSLFLHAHELAKPLGPLAGFSGTKGRLVAARLAVHLGAPTLSRRLTLAAYRHAPDDPLARAAFAGVLLEERGPFEAWVRTAGIRWIELPAEAAAHFVSVRAGAAILLRDFDAATAVLDEAEAAGIDDVVLPMRRSALLEAQDRYDEALALAREVGERWPGYQSVWRWIAHLLVLLGRRDEAMEVLSAAADRMESAALVWTLAGHQADARMHDARAANLRRYAELSPLMEEEPRRALEASLSDLAYRRGDIEAAIAHARRSEVPAYRDIAERLAQGGPDRQVLLDVPYVRQHRQTCVPATLAALGRFWDRPAEHLAVAEAICHDGTPAHSERRWAQENGWAAREFRVTWDAVVALLDRGVPIALHTQGPLSGHCQAIIGYDARRGTMTIRDPYVYGDLDVFGAELIEHQRASGPRGLALVPQDREALLDGLDLPDTALHDRHHALHRALDAHDRAAAGAEADALEAEGKDHVVTLAARRALAVYDGHFPDLHAAARRLLDLFPDNARARLDVHAAMCELATRDERIAFLEPFCSGKRPDPIFLARLAREIAADARELPRAERLARRAVRSPHPTAEALACLASVLRQTPSNRDEALSCLRFAACTEDLNEQFSRMFFGAALSSGRARAAEALEWLEGRFRRFGRRSAGPAITLAGALEQLDRTERAFEIIEEALSLRPDDGALKLAAADMHARHGTLDRARALLAGAEGHVPRTDWLCAAAQIARHADPPDVRIALWRQVLEAAPLSLEAHASLVELLAAEHGLAAAAEHLAAATARFPRSIALRSMRVEQLRAAAPAVREAAVRELLAIEPANAWASRELALVLAVQRRDQEAAAAATTVERLAPHAAPTWLVRAVVHARAGEVEAARGAFRRAIELDADSAPAVSGLLGLQASPAERVRDVEEIAALLERRSITGEGVLAWMPAARPYLDPAALHARLVRLREARPELWTAWSTSVEHLVDMGRADEAGALLSEALRRFPHVPPLWIEAADFHAAQGDTAAEIEALERALEVSPLDGGVLLRRVEAHLRDGDDEGAALLLERAARKLPLDERIGRDAAVLAWRAGRREEAIERVGRLAALHPDEEHLWTMGFHWHHAVSGPDRAVAWLRNAAAARPHDAQLRCVLADALITLQRGDLALTVLDEALAIARDHVPAHGLRARALLQLGRAQEAAWAHYSPVFGAKRPPELRLQEAVFEADRGHLTQAVQLVDGVLRESPGDAFGFLLLVRCQQLRGEPGRALAAAQELVRLAPRNADAHRHLAEARLDTGDRAGAIASHRRAVAIAPGDLRSAVALFELHHEDRDADAAARVLALLSRSAPATAASLGVRLELLRGDAGAALDRMRTVCITPTVMPAQIWATRAALIHAGLAGEAHALFTSLLGDPAAHREVGRVVTRTLAARGNYRSGLPLLAGLDAAVPASRAAALEAIGLALPNWLAWHDFTVLRRHRAFFRAHTELWSGLGQLLVAHRKAHTAVLWLRDHRERERPPAVALWCLSRALVLQGRTARASEVSERALTAAEQDACSRAHLTRAAFHRALRGETEEAAARLAHVDQGALDAKAAGLHRLTTTLLAVQRTPAEQRAAMLPWARQELSLVPHDADWNDAQRRLVRDIRSMSAVGWRYGNPLIVGAGFPLIALGVVSSRSVAPEHRLITAIVALVALPVVLLLYFAARRLLSRL